MSRKIILPLVVMLLLLAGFLRPAAPARATAPQAPASAPTQVSAFDLILAMNTLRVSLGNSALIEDPIINAVAQATAQTMAANNMSWHIGDVSGRIQAAGYGGGAKVWATENFAVGTGMGLDQIMVIWSDAAHMLPATNAAYCHIGAGVAQADNGRIYYVLQAAYIAGQQCGSNTSSGGNTGGNNGGNGSTGGNGGSTIPQFIIPVKIATPDAEGKIYHTVEFGQSFWSIAIAYQITIADLEYWNNLSRDDDLWVGQKLFIPTKDTEGYATPTPVGMVLLATPDADGKIVHEVQSYQTLSSIAAAYSVPLTSLLNFNGWQEDWPLQIGQKIVVSPGKILSPLEQLTPNADGNYYHTVKSGETLSGIATAYGLTLETLLNWNGLNNTSIIFPGEKLLLPVTPPAPPTNTPAPETPPPAEPAATLSPTPTPSSLPRSATPDAPVPSATPTPGPLPNPLAGSTSIGILILLGGLGLLIWVMTRRKATPEE